MFNLKFYLISFVSINCVLCQIGPTQPTWTINENSQKKPIKVEANLKNLLETASLRNEVDTAVLHRHYAIGGDDEERIVHEADEELGEDFRKSYLHTLVGEPLKGLDLDYRVYQPKDNAEKPLHDWLVDIVPNRVASSLMDDDENGDADDDTDGVFIPEYHATKYKSDSSGRDVLQLNRIEEDLNFSLGKGVRMWKGLKSGDLLAVSGKTVMLVKKMDAEYQIVKSVEFTEPIESLETITFWNRTKQASGSLALVATGTSIEWLNCEDLSNTWEWYVGTKVFRIRKFDVDRDQYLATLTEGLIIIYQFNITAREYFSTQAITVEKNTRNIEFIDAGYAKILAIPQTNKVKIYHSSTSSQDLFHFKKTSSIVAPNVTTIHAFQTGGFSYLAVSGDEPTIFRYHFGSFRPQTILDPSFGFVDLFLAVPCPTYRDDLILLVQHNIRFETHSINVLEPLIWNGEAFEATRSVPCKIGDTIELFGVSCILDVEREQGLEGSTVITMHDQVFLLVPRNEAPSGLFQIHTELVSRSTELDHLELIITKMESLVADQERIISSLETQQWRIDHLETNQLVFDGAIEKLLLNSNEWTEEDTAVNLDQLLAELESFGLDFEDMKKNLIVERAVIKDLYLDSLNGEPYQELKEIAHDGRIVIEGNLMADKLVQLPFELVSSPDGPGEFDLVEIHGDLKFDFINGIAWEDFLEEVVFKDKPNELDYVQVEKLAIESDLSVDTINGLRFPGDFLMSSGPKSSKISGKKTFVNMLNTNAMDCEGTINNLYPSNFITLNHDQVISGTTTFSQLEVIKSFEINGTVFGKNLEEFVKNPTLLDTNFIESECQFRKLFVDGPVIIKGLHNDKKFDETLNDVVFFTNQNILINSTKQFKEIELDDSAFVKSNEISGIPLDDFLTRSTDQQLSITQIESSVTIENLQLSGLYNFVNVTEMERNSIKLDENQVLNISLIFNEPSLLEANTLEVLESVNGVSVKDFVNINEPIHLKTVIANEIIVDQLNTLVEIEGEGKLNGVDLDYFNRFRFSISSNQTIDSNLIANHIIAETDLVTKSINGFPIDNALTAFSEKSSNILNTIKSSKHIKIIGNIKTTTINGIDTKQLWSDVIWLDRPNIVQHPIQFLDSTHMKKDLQSNLINKNDFEVFTNNLVLRGDHNIMINGTKKFTSPIHVFNDATIHYFNEIPADKLATKTKPLKFEHDLHVNGDLVVHSLEIEGEKFGDYKVQEIFEKYQYDPKDDMHYINGKVVFNGETIIEQLNVGERINEDQNVEELFVGIVYKNASGRVEGKKVFQNSVSFDQGVYVDKMNDVDVKALVKNVIYVNEKVPVEIHRPVVFQSSITADHSYVDGNIQTESVMDCKLRDWLDNSLRVDQPADIEGPLYFQATTLDGNSLHVKRLNNVEMYNVITLNSEQKITGDISFPRVYLHGTVKVEGKVNGIDLEKEFNNTLLTTGNQHIKASIEIQRIQVAKKLETLKPISNRDLREVATLKDNLLFRTPLTFKRITTENVYTDDLISGHNLTDWYQKSLKINTTSYQNITGTWSINELKVDTKSVVINPPINFRNDTELFSMSRNLQANYKTFCDQTMKLKQQVAERVSFLKYLKRDLEFIREKPIDYMHPIVLPDTTLLLINEECISKIYQWNTDADKFKRIAQIETGHLSGVGILDDHEFLTYPKASPTACRIFGTLKWKLEGNSVVGKESIGSSRRIVRSNRCSRAIRESYPVFNSRIDSITQRLIRDIQQVRNDSSLQTSSSFGHKIKELAHKLWVGFTQLEDVRTIIDHAHQVYHSIKHSNHHDHEYSANSTDNKDNEEGGNIHGGSVALNDHLDFPDKHDYQHHNLDKDETVGAPPPSPVIIPPLPTPHIIVPALPTQSNIPQNLPADALKAIHRLEGLLDAIPLGFSELVKSTSSTINDHDFESQLRNLVNGVTKAAYTMQSVGGSTTPKRRNAEHRIKVARSLAVLKSYEEKSDLFSVYASPEITSDKNITKKYTQNDQHREAITFEVGSQKNRRKLIAVISSADLESIRLYSHSLEGNIFQRIATQNPYMLTAVEIHDETILAFIDDHFVIRVMKYKGVEGFVEWSSFRTDPDYPVTQLSSLSLVKGSSYCRTYYLISTKMNRIQFYQVIIGGMCPLKMMVENCDGWW